METNTKSGNCRGLLAVILIWSPLLNACAERKAPALATGTGASKLVPVSIQTVNHTAETVSFVLTDPANRDNRGGGETVNAFAAGGNVCCYSLPSIWRPGLKVEVAELYWLPRRADGSIPEVKRSHLLEVPRYVDGKVGDLWVTREPGGAVSIASTSLEPDHPDYPGNIKGWPVPDVAYKRVIHDRYIRDAEESVELYLQSLSGLSKDPTAHAQEAWEFSREHDAVSLKPFKGPSDPAYQTMLKQTYIDGLTLARRQLKDRKAARP